MSTTYENYSINPYTQYLSPFDATQSSMVIETNERASDEMSTNVSTETSIHEEMDKDGEDDDEYCQICGDNASGWHCG